VEKFIQELRDDLKRDEGYHRYPYFDQYCYVTIGVGHNLHANPLTDTDREMGMRLGPTTGDFIEYLLDEDLQVVHRYLTDYFGWIDDLPLHQQRALYNMCFQLGAKEFAEFEPTWRHLRAGELDLVERHLRNSLWFRQTTKRAERVINLLIRGK
jgi:GH24 family phage-related lysozyme (muramidase)